MPNPKARTILRSSPLYVYHPVANVSAIHNPSSQESCQSRYPQCKPITKPHCPKVLPSILGHSGDHIRLLARRRDLPEAYICKCTDRWDSHSWSRSYKCNPDLIRPSVSQVRIRVAREKTLPIVDDSSEGSEVKVSFGTKSSIGLIVISLPSCALRRIGLVRDKNWGGQGSISCTIPSAWEMVGEITRG